MFTGKVPVVPFLFLAEHLAVDLLNTVIAVEGRRVDLLVSPGDVARWGDAAGIVPRWAWGAKTGRREPRRLRRFRETLRHGLTHWSRTGEVEPRLTAALNRAMSGDPQRVVAVPRHGQRRIELQRVSTGSPESQLYAAIARSAAMLLAEGERRRLRHCANPACLLQFYDVSKAGRRRWCSMLTCGARSKARAHYNRTRRGTQGDRLRRR